MRATPGSPAARPERPAAAPLPSRGEDAASPHELARGRLLASLAEEPALRARAQPAPARWDAAGKGPRERATLHLALLRAAPATASGGAAEQRERWSEPLGERWRQPRSLGARLWRRLAEVRVPAQLGIAGLVAYLVLLNFSVVRGSSMSPSIRDGDRILIDQVTYFFRDVQRGDVVVLRYPLDPSVEYIKRVVGLPGDDVVIRRGQVLVNGKVLDEPYVRDPDPRAFLSTIVRPGHYFVLGDNRPHSADSREFGQIPHSYLRGKVDLRVWPFTRLGWID